MIALVALVALVVALVATPAAAKIAERSGLLDRPGPLKIQRQPVPYLGGMAIFTAAAVGVVVGRPALAIPAGLALVLGTVDDAAGLSPRFRLVCDIAIGLVAGAVVPLSHGVLGWLGTALLVVIMINALNMIDGLDGLAGGVSMASAIGFAVLLHGSIQLLGVALAASLAGFLWYNRPPARIYLGDGGSYLLGTWLAVFAAMSWRSPTPWRHGAPALLLLAVPIVELIAAVLRRVRGGHGLFAGDRDHIYDQLVASGWTAGHTTATCIAAQAAFVTIGLAAAWLSTSTAMAAGVTLVALVGVVMAIAAAGFLAPARTRRVP